MPIDTQHFLIEEGKRIDVRERPTTLPPVYESKKDYRTILKQHVEKLAALQHKLYAENSQSLLLVLQAMDTGGKDGIIRHVLSGINPQGCRVYSFGKPSATELQHDFLWRTTQVLPERGDIGVFNRSYYEEVLVVRVHPEILDGQNLPAHIATSDKIWKQRFESIREHENHLHANGTKVVKMFLNISHDEQRRRLLDRILDPTKNWKFKANDLDEREHWDAYMDVYSDCISETSTKDAPWYVLPGDDKRNARLFAAQILLETLEKMNPQYPAVEPDQLDEIEASRQTLIAQA